MEDCLFCSIAAGKIPSTKVYEDDTVYVFKDIAPIAPIHYLLIPKQHIACAADITLENSGVVAHIYEVAAKIAAKEGISDGFRIITNCGEKCRSDCSPPAFPYASWCQDGLGQGICSGSGIIITQGQRWELVFGKQFPRLVLTLRKESPDGTFQIC